MDIPKDCIEKWQSLHKTEKHFVIRSGLQCVEYAKSVVSDDEQKKMRLDYESQLQKLHIKLTTSQEYADSEQEQIKLKYEKRIQLLSDELDQIRQTSQSREQKLLNTIEEVEQKSMRQAMTMIQERETQISTPLMKQIDDMRNEMQKLRDNQQEREQKIMDSSESRERESAQQFRSQIEMLRNQITTQQTNIDTLTSKLTEQMEKNQMYSKSTLLGGAGQSDIMDLLNGSFLSREGWFIEDTSGIPEKGDIHIIPPDSNTKGSVLVEIKNYTRSIPKHEILKFKRDLMKNDVGCGIFISLQTSIQGYANRSVEMIMDEKEVNKPIIYLQGRDERDILAQWVLIMSKITVDLFNKVSSKMDQTITAQEVQSHINTIIDRIKPIQSQITTLTSSFQENIKVLTNLVTKLLQDVTDIGSEYGVMQRTVTRQKSSGVDEINIINKWVEKHGRGEFEGKPFMEFLKENGVNQTKGYKIRSLYCDEIKKSGKKHFKLKSHIQ